MAADAGEEAARASLLASLGAMEVLAGNEHGLDRIRAALELSGSLGESEPLSRGYVNLVISLREMGSSEEGVKACRRGSEVMTRMGGLGLERVVAALEACMAVERGDLEAGARRAREVLDPGRTSKPVPVLLFAAHALAAALMRQGESRPDARRAR